MYDPSIGKWLSADPIGFDGKDTNLYRYVANRPTNATDPTGLFTTRGPRGVHGSGSRTPPKLIGGAMFYFTAGPGDGKFFIQKVKVTGTLSGKDSCGEDLSLTFSYEYTEAWNAWTKNGQPKKVADTHNNGPTDSIAAIAGVCGCSIDWRKPWSFESTAVFKLQTGDITNRTRIAGIIGVTQVVATTTVTCGDGTTKTLRETSKKPKAVMDMYPGASNAPGPKNPIQPKPVGQAQTCTDTWTASGGKDGSKTYDGKYNSTGYH